MSLVPYKQRKENTMSILKRDHVGNYRSVLALRKIIEKILLEVMFKHEKRKKCTQIASSKGGEDLTNLMTSNEDVAGYAE